MNWVLFRRTAVVETLHIFIAECILFYDARLKLPWPPALDELYYVGKVYYLKTLSCNIHLFWKEGPNNLGLLHLKEILLKSLFELVNKIVIACKYNLWL